MRKTSKHFTENRNKLIIVNCFSVSVNLLFLHPMKKIFFQIVIIFLPFFLSAQVPPPQEDSGNTLYDTTLQASENFNPEEVKEAISKKKLRVNVEVGATFGGSSYYGSYFGTYIAPRLSYDFTPRFTLSGGISLASYYGIGNNGPEYAGMNMYSGYGMPTSSVFIEGSYRLTENLAVYGAVHQQIDLLNIPGQTQNNTNYNFNGTSVRMGFKYKVSDNVFIQGEVGFSNQPYRYNPYYGGFQSDPFSSPMMNQRRDPFNNPF